MSFFAKILFPLKAVGIRRAMYNGSFVPNGSSAPSTTYFRGDNFTVVHSATGVWLVTLDSPINDLVVCSDLALATAGATIIQTGKMFTKQYYQISRTHCNSKLRLKERYKNQQWKIQFVATGTGVNVSEDAVNRILRITYQATVSTGADVDTAMAGATYWEVETANTTSSALTAAEAFSDLSKNRNASFQICSLTSGSLADIDATNGNRISFVAVGRYGSEV